MMQKPLTANAPTTKQGTQAANDEKKTTKEKKLSPEDDAKLKKRLDHGSNSCGPSLTSSEAIVLAQAWVRTSKDPIVGTNLDLNAFSAKLYANYKNYGEKFVIKFPAQKAEIPKYNLN